MGSACLVMSRQNQKVDAKHGQALRLWYIEYLGSVSIYVFDKIGSILSKAVLFPCVFSPRSGHTMNR